MHAESAVAGFICLSLALGHATAGRRLLPNLVDAPLPPTPFGPPSISHKMIEFSWHAITIALLTFAGLLTSLAWMGASPAVLTFRWLGGGFLAATFTSAWLLRRHHPKVLTRAPMPLLFAVVAVMCALASRTS